MTFTFLGTGTSVGVPQIGCQCKVCTSPDPRDRRRRCGAYVQSADAAFLIDAPPEMREACIEYKIDKVDAIALTHAHMDHFAGFDDVRRFNTINGTWVECDPKETALTGRTRRCIGKVMTCYAMAETEKQMHQIFPYIGTKAGEKGLYRPQVQFDNSHTFNIGSMQVERLKVEHGFDCCGYLVRERGSSIAYISDCHEIPEDTLERIYGVDVLALNCLRERSHPTHLNLDSSLSYIKRINPGKAYLVHMCHDFLHEEWLKKLAGSSVEPAYDGLTLTL